MDEIKYACIITEDDINKRYCISVSDIYLDKKANPIQPKNKEDFNENQKYYVYWRSCGTTCSPKDKCCSFYKSFILSLGESAEDALEAKEKRNKRFKFKKNFLTTSESNESSLEEEVKLSHNSRSSTKNTLKKKANDINNINIAHKYKKEMMLNSREKLELDDGNEENVSIEKSPKNKSFEDLENYNPRVSLNRISISTIRNPLSLKQTEQSSEPSVTIQGSLAEMQSAVNQLRNSPSRSPLRPSFEPGSKLNSEFSIKSQSVIGSQSTFRTPLQSKSESTTENHSSEKKSRPTSKSKCKSINKSMSPLRSPSHSPCKFKSTSKSMVQLESDTTPRTTSRARRRIRSRSPSQYLSGNEDQIQFRKELTSPVCGLSRSRSVSESTVLSGQTPSSSRNRLRYSSISEFVMSNEQLRSLSRKELKSPLRGQSRSRSRSVTTSTVPTRQTPSQSRDQLRYQSMSESQVLNEQTGSSSCKEITSSIRGRLRSRSRSRSRSRYLSCRRILSVSPDASPPGRGLQTSNVESTSPMRSQLRSRSSSSNRSRDSTSNKFESSSGSKSQSSSPDRLQSPSPDRSQSPSPDRSQSPSTDRLQSPSGDSLQSPSDDRSRSPPRGRFLNSRQLPPSSRCEQLNNAENENLRDSENDETEIDEHYCMLQKHKPRLYRQFKKLNLLLPPAREQYNRYDPINDMIYLGLGIKVGKQTWNLLKRKGIGKFCRETATVLWKKTLSNICLEKKVTNSIPNRSPVKLANPKKLELYLSLVRDYINGDDRYKNLEEQSKIFMIDDSIRRLSIHIRDNRRKLLASKKN